MFVGVGRFELFIPHSGSLKDKRQVLRAVASVIQKKLNVSISEVDHQDLWQRATFGVSCVADSVGHCQKVLQEVEKTIAKTALGAGEIVGRSIEVVSMDDLESLGR